MITFSEKVVLKIFTSTLPTNQKLNQNQLFNIYKEIIFLKSILYESWKGEKKGKI